MDTNTFVQHVMTAMHGRNRAERCVIDLFPMTEIAEDNERRGTRVGGQTRHDFVFFQPDAWGNRYEHVCVSGVNKKQQSVQFRGQWSAPVLC